MRAFGFDFCTMLRREKTPQGVGQSVPIGGLNSALRAGHFVQERRAPARRQSDRGGRDWITSERGSSALAGRAARRDPGGVNTPRCTQLLLLLAAPNALVAVCPHIGFAHWSLDLLASFAVQAALLLLALAVAFTAARKWAHAAAAMIACSAAAAAFLPAWIASSDSPHGVENRAKIRVAALNLLKNNAQGLEDALEVLRAASPDVVWFAEYTPAWQEVLRAGLPEMPFRIERPDVSSFGAALYSRYPFRTAAMVSGGDHWIPFGRAVVETPHGPVGVLGVPAPPPQLNALGVAERDLSLATVAARLTDLPRRRIVLGDFNATPWNHAFRAMRRDAGLSLGSTRWWLPTWPDPQPALLRIPIDHVLVSGDLRVIEARLGATIQSDHRPLLATIQVGE
ncbi:MAG: hypothetical protein CMJ88_07345 [Planctomycetes bacterium]|nr:hypothetical protein [Planctomycetota bacterium]